MKRLKSVNVLFGMLLLAAFMLASCGSNSSKNNQGNSKDSQEQFKETVHNFDSSWNQRLETLNASIAQWDSSAQDKKGVMKDRMESRLKDIKKQRDSLNAFLESSKSKTEENWEDFKASVTEKYKSVVGSINKLSQD